MKRILVLALIGTLPSFVSALDSAIGEVTSLDGNIIYVSPDGDKRTLTTTGLDTNPALSPDGQTVVFVRSTLPDHDGHIRWFDCAIWTIDIDGHNARSILACQDAEDDKDVICNVSGLIYSPDGKQLYFHCWTWVVEYAIHVLDLETNERRFVTSGILHRVIPRGQYAGHLLVEKRRYFMSGGTYTFVWLVAPDGKDVGPVYPLGSDSPDLQLFWNTYVK